MISSGGGERGALVITTWDFLGEGRESSLPGLLDEGGRRMVGLGSDFCAILSQESQLCWMLPASVAAFKPWTQ